MKTLKRHSMAILALLVIVCMFSTILALTASAAEPFKVVEVTAGRAGDFLGIHIYFDHNYAPQEIGTKNSAALNDYIKINGLTLTEISEIDALIAPNDNFYDSSYCPGAVLDRIDINLNVGENCNIPSIPVDTENDVIEILPGLESLTGYITTENQIFIRNNATDPDPFVEASEIKVSSITIVRNDDTGFAFDLKFDASIAGATDMDVQNPANAKYQAAINNNILIGGTSLAEFEESNPGAIVATYLMMSGANDSTKLNFNLDKTKLPADFSYDSIEILSGFATPANNAVFTDVEYALSATNPNEYEYVEPVVSSSEPSSSEESSSSSNSSSTSSDLTSSTTSSQDNTSTPGTGDFMLINLAVMGIAAAGSAIAIKKRK